MRHVFISICVFCLLLVSVLTLMVLKNQSPTEFLSSLTAQQSSLEEGAVFRAHKNKIEAHAREVEKKRIETEAQEYGILCWADEIDLCEELVVRAEENPALAHALLQAKRHKVVVFPEHEFHVGEGIIRVDVRKSDEKICLFLVGDQCLM